MLVKDSTVAIALAYSGGTPSRGGGPRNVANISLGMVI